MSYVNVTIKLSYIHKHVYPFLYFAVNSEKNIARSITSIRVESIEG